MLSAWRRHRVGAARAHEDVFFHDVSRPIQAALDARRVPPLLASPATIVLGGDLSRVRVRTPHEDRFQFVSRDVGRCAPALLERFHMAVAPVLPHPALRTRLTDAEPPSEEDVSPFSTLV